jgi:hypothetical protein
VQLADLRVDGMFALSVDFPRGGVPAAFAFDEVLAVLDVEHLDVFGPIDFRDPNELTATQATDVEAHCHGLILAPQGDARATEQRRPELPLCTLRLGWHRVPNDDEVVLSYS